VNERAALVVSPLPRRGGSPAAGSSSSPVQSGNGLRIARRGHTSGHKSRSVRLGAGVRRIQCPPAQEVAQEFGPVRLRDRDLAALVVDRDLDAAAAGRVPEAGHAPDTSRMTQTTVEDRRLLLRADEVAAALSCSVSTVRWLYRTGRLPAVRLTGNRALWFDREDVERLIADWKEAS
jgi:excisionase family DNA binding protein